VFLGIFTAAEFLWYCRGNFTQGHSKSILNESLFIISALERF
jgi:hypothetical protein